MQKGIDFIGVSVGALIFNSKGEIFLNKRSQKARNARGCWEAPGGAVNFWETRQAAIKREIKEEFGVEIKIKSMLHTVEEMLLEEKQHWLATSFICEFKKGQIPRIMEPDKHEAIGWFSLTSLPKPLSLITTMDLNAYKKLFKTE